jgi:hypothetical protein
MGYVMWEDTWSLCKGEEMRQIEVKKIQKTIKFIETQLSRLEMNLYGIKKGSPEAKTSGFTSNRWPSCHTKACFAGWTVLLETPKREWNKLFRKDGLMRGSTHGKAARILGLTAGEASDIFIGPATWELTTKSQLRALKISINQVFADRGIKERV